MKHFLQLTLIVVFTLMMSTGPAHAAEPVMADYTSYPLFLTDTVEPNILIMLDNSGSMNYNAYGPGTDSGNLVGDSYLGVPFNTIISTVTTSSDDAEENNTDDNAYFNNADLDLGRDIGTTHPDQIIGVRFQDVKIPEGATIDNAYSVFTCMQVYGAAQSDIQVNINAHDTANSGTFTADTADLSNRTKTSATVSWTIPPWNTVDEEHSTPNLKTVVQEIVDRDDWKEGNDISFIISNPSPPDSGRMAYAHDQDANKAARLVIEISDETAKRYYGYFNPEYFYFWDSNDFVLTYKKVAYVGTPGSGGYWEAEDMSGSAVNLTDALVVSESLWDGNWMNWMTMRRIDVLRKVIMGGLATSRTGGGNQTNYGESPPTFKRITAGGDEIETSYNYVRNFDSTGTAAVSPYHGNYYFEMEGGYIYVGSDMDPSDGYTARYDIRVKKNVSVEPRDFYNYDSGDNLAGVLQRYWNKARWGNEFFNYGTGNNLSGGRIAATIGTGITSLITDLQNTHCDTHTPLAESYYLAMQYFKQEDVEAGLEFPNNAVPNANLGDDPYYNSALGEYVSCAKSFVILLTDGASTKDSMIPSDLKDYDPDSNDNIACDETSETGCDYIQGGTDFLDDVALYARTNDLRDDLSGEQNLILYTVYALSDDDNARKLLKDAARNGGFEDRNSNNLPDLDAEWDKNGDGNPDTYFEATDGYALERALGNAITDILRRAASGTSVSIISSATEGEGNIIQAFFRPAVPKGEDDIKWVGSLHSLWIDPRGNIREDTNGNHGLDLDADRILEYTDVNGETKVKRFAVSAGAEYPDISAATPVDTVKLTEIIPIWEAGSNLDIMDPDDRNIFTRIDMDEDQVIDEGTVAGAIDAADDPLDNTGELVRFDTDVPALKPYLGVESNAAWSELGAAHDDRFNNIVNFIRGENSGFTGGALIRDRNIDGLANHTWKLGDIVHSTPIFVTAPLENYDLLYGDESYFNFYKANKDREVMVYVGANDGMIHAFTSWDYNRSTKTFTRPAAAPATESIGDELWAYIPQSLLPHLKWLPSLDYTHVYYNDLRLKVFDAKILPDDTHVVDADSDPDWGTFILAGMNYGGRHIWAKGDYDDGAGNITNETRHFFPSYTLIDVTQPRNPMVVWEKSYSIPSNPGESADNHTDMGLAVSYPAVMKVKEKWFAVIGSGPKDFEGTSADNGHVFVVDLATGAPYKNGTNDWLFQGANTKAFMGSAAALDKNMNYNVDAVYIGETYESNNPDWEGSLYKITIPFVCDDIACDFPTTYGITEDGSYVDDPLDATNPWLMHKMFASPGPVTAAPSISVDPLGNSWVYFGTGRYFSNADEANVEQQYMFGIKDPFFNKEHGGVDTIFNDNYYMNYASSLTLSDADLQNMDDYMVLTDRSVFDGTTYLPGGYYDLLDLIYNADGWERLLPISGERVINKPGLIGGAVLMPTFVPASDICGFGGTSYLYGLFYLTGTSYFNPIFHGGGGIAGAADGKLEVTIDEETKYQTIDKISLGEGLASTPGIHVGRQDEYDSGDSDEPNTASSFTQTSTGRIVKEDIEPPLRIRSGLKSWQEK
mgnify:CR=1 FL=1